MQKKYDFFILYNKNDIKYAKHITTALKASGFSCWWQAEDSKQEYAIEIKKALTDSNVFIVILSSSSANSEWVGREILDALRLYSKNEIKILPIAIDNLDKNDYGYFHHILGDFNWLFASSFDSDKAIVSAITNQASLHLREASINSIYSAEDIIERERLDKQNNLYNRFAKHHFDSLFSKLTNPSILDVGCFDAKNILSRLEGRSFSKLLCIDKNQDIIEHAKATYDSENIDFLVADITSKDFITPLKSYLNNNNLSGFDLIHVSSVLLHIKNPEKVLSALHSCLTDNGFIFIQEEDDGLNLSFQEKYDEPCFFDDCFYIWKYSKESGDRHMGRKIPQLLKNAGYQNISLLSSTISSVDFNGECKEDLWDMYFNPEYWVVDNADYFFRRDAYDKFLDYKKKHKKMKNRFMKNQLFLTIGVLFFVANK